MATRKKKVEDQITDAVTVIKGSHLTVTKHPNGRTELQWDDEALLRDVREAIASVENKKSTKKAKK